VFSPKEDVDMIPGKLSAIINRCRQNYRRSTWIVVSILAVLQTIEGIVGRRIRRERNHRRTLVRRRLWGFTGGSGLFNFNWWRFKAAVETTPSRVSMGAIKKHIKASTGAGYIKFDISQPVLIMPK
jgi:hypothetical protein